MAAHAPRGCGGWVHRDQGQTAPREWVMHSELKRLALGSANPQDLGNATFCVYRQKTQPTASSSTLLRHCIGNCVRPMCTECRLRFHLQLL